MFYDIMRVIGIITGYPAQLLFFKKKIYYENERAKGRTFRGGALVVSNHFNPLDYVANVFVFFPRKLCVVASEDAFRNKLQSFGMKFWGGIQANRVTGNMSFIRESINEIKKGNLVQIFPEGHNTPDGKIHPFYPSYVLIPLHSKAPIIPVVTDGNYGLFKRTHIIVGEAIDLSEHIEGKRHTSEELHGLNDMVFNRVLELREELERRKNEEKRGKKN